MPTRRALPSAGVVGGEIYVIGGQGSPTSIVEAYNPVTDTWTQKADMPTARSHSGAAAVNGLIYVIGGDITSGIPAAVIPTVEAYDTGVGIRVTAISPQEGPCHQRRTHSNGRQQLSPQRSYHHWGESID